MRLRCRRSATAWRVAPLGLLLCVLFPVVAATAADLPTPAPPPFAAAAADPGDMSSAGWLGHVTMQLENEAMSDVGMLPDAPAAVVREWRSFDRDGSSLGALVNVLWTALAGCLALLVERGVARGLGRRVRRAMRLAAAGPTLVGLLVLLLCDIAGVVVFAGVFVWSRHWLMRLGVTLNLVLFAADVLIRWRVAMVVVRALLRPRDAPARLLAIPDGEARQLARFLSVALLAVVVLVGFGRLGLADEDSGAPHIIGLVVAGFVCAIYSLIIYRARGVFEALLRGDSAGLFGAFRAAVAGAWVPIGLAAVAALMLFFVFGLSLGLLSYYHAVVSTLGLLLVLLVFERLTARGWRDAAAGLAANQAANQMDRLVARSLRRILRATVLLVVAVTLTSVWIEAIEMSEPQAARAMYAAATAFGTLFVAYLAWELARLAIDRHVQPVGVGPKLPGDDEEELTPGSRLQTVLPMLRAGFGVVIAIIATLVVLSHLGIDTAPLIAGAGVFGLAISFGSQSLVRDIISGLFYMWDDAFRVGEYIDTGRLKGTVEALGIRSVKLRHHNGPLHTIPYGQLGAVSNQSRDFATIKFNLRLEPGTDIELVRRTAKRIGLDMQAEPEIAGEVILPLKMQGIVEVADTALVVRFKFTARPVKPSWVQREYLKRIYKVFAEKGIAFASGALTLRTSAAAAAEAEPKTLVATDAGLTAPVLPAPSHVG